jgi:hypothetical protein
MPGPTGLWTAILIAALVVLILVALSLIGVHIDIG